jgi:FkbM family methyltransferase
MNESIARAKRTYTEEGILSLCKKFIRLLNTKKIRFIDNKYWDWRGGTQTLSVGQISAEFDAGSDAGGNMIRWTYLNERSMLEGLLDELEGDDVFFDIGSNLGFFSCFAANYMSDGSVVAFEPHPPNARQLRRNVSHNNPETVDVHQVALSDSDGEIEFTNQDSLSSTASFETGGNTTTVEQIQGDSLVDSGIPQPTVVKIDVEGAEPMVIAGMTETLSHPDCRVLFCEIHLPKDGRPSIEDYGYELDEVLETIQGFGFQIVEREFRGEALHLTAKK